MIDVINLSGRKYAGKDFAFQHIERVVVDRPVVAYRWADPLKDDVVRMMAAVGVTVTREELDDNNHPNKAMWTGLMQWYGTDYRRRQDWDYWVNRGCESIRRRLEDPYTGNILIVINDSRFVNEVDRPKALFGKHCISIRLEVGDEKQDERAARLGHEPLTPERRHHVSETNLDGYGSFDYVIDSNRSLDYVYEELDRVLVECRIKIQHTLPI